VFLKKINTEQKNDFADIEQLVGEYCCTLREIITRLLSLEEDHATKWLDEKVI
jgi:hypothetical protein